jgi:hypothetical protein
MELIDKIPILLILFIFAGTLSFMIKQPESQYQSYLLRVWRDSEEKIWRVMLEHVGTHERHGFADLESLCAFLREQMSNETRASQNTGRKTESKV